MGKKQKNTIMEDTVLIKGKVRYIKYQQTKVGDLVYDMNTKSTYVATIEDADDMNWIVIDL